jgi:GGDEF domain-containing protein
MMVNKTAMVGVLIGCLVVVGSSQASAEVVVVVGAKNPAPSLSREQVSDIFMGKVTAMPGGGNVIISEDVALEIAQKLINEISQSISLEHGDAALTASIGIAFSSTVGKPPKALLSAADSALYEAKNVGKNTCRIFMA